MSPSDQIKFGIGLVEVTVGTGACTLGVGCAVGAPLILDGADNITEAVTGRSALSHASEAVLNDPQLGTDVDMVLDVIILGHP